MAATKYTYSISEDFPNQKENTDRLTKEISDDVSITTALAYVSTAGDECDIWFVNELSAPEITALNTVVANHSGDPLIYTERAYGESLQLLITSNTTWVEKLKLTLPNCHAATYRLEWTFEWSTTSESFPIYIRVQIDDITSINEYVMVAEKAQTEYAGSGFAQVVFTEGAHYVDVDLKSDSNNYAVGIRNVRIEAIEVE